MSSGPRSALDRTTVLNAGIRFADAEGLGSLSMRRLAAQLGVVPMALYKHVADKDDLLAGMIDVVVAGYPAPTSGLDWRDRVRARVLGARTALLRHPWLRPAIESSTRRTASVLTHMDAVAGEFVAAGFSADLTHHAMHALGHRIWGFSPEAFDDRTAPPSAAEASELARMADRWPHIMAITRDSLERTRGAGCDADAEFAFTLDLLLEAFDRLRAQGWSSGPSSSV